MESPLPPDETPSAPTEETLSARTGTAATAVTARPQPSQLTLLIVGAVGILAGIAFVAAFSWLRGEAPVQTAVAASAAVAPATKPASPVAASEPAPTWIGSDPAPTWIGSRKATIGRDGSRTIAFELPAIQDVPVWMSRARPVLVVQCLSRQTQAFVFLGTSTAFEEDEFKRTVRVQWDDGAPTAERWPASESSQELLAPDGVAFVRQLARTNRLRFGFTPFNAQPVTVDFAVQGFDQFAGLVASTCGWRL